MVFRAAALVAALCSLAPSLAGAETMRIRVKGVGELYGEVEDLGDKLSVTTITGEKQTFPKAKVLSVQSLAEPPGLEPAVVVDAASAAPAPASSGATQPAAAAPPAAQKADGPQGADALAAMTKRLKEDPALLAELAAIVQEDPSVRDALSDPSLLKAVTGGDAAAAEKSPAFSKIAGNPKIQALVKRLSAEQGQ